MNINIEKRNVETQIASLKEELVGLSKKISKAYFERDEVNKNLMDINKDIDRITSGKERKIKELDSMFSEKEHIWKERIEGYRVENERLRKERKDLLSILESLNLRIMRAEICFQDLENKKEALLGEMPLLEQRKNEREKIDKDIERLRKDYDEAFLKYDDISKKSNKVIGEMQHQVLTAQNKVEECERKAADAEIRYKMYIREHLTRENDIEIHRQRLEARIQGVMPNFNLKLK